MEMDGSMEEIVDDERLASQASPGAPLGMTRAGLLLLAAPMMGQG